MKQIGTVSESTSNVDIAIASQRLGAIQLELEREVARKKEPGHLPISEQIVDQVQQLVKFTENQFTPEQLAAMKHETGSTVNNKETSLHLGPQNLTPSVLSNPDALSMEPFAVQRRLRNLAHAIRTISRRLKRHSRPVLTTDTMNQVQSLFQPYDTVKEKEHKLGAYQISGPSKAQTIRINKQICRMVSNAATKIHALSHDRLHTLASKAIIEEVLQSFEAYFDTHQAQMDHINYSTMLVKTVQLAAQCGWTTIILRSHAQFTRKLIMKGAQTFHELDSFGACYALWAVGKLGKQVWSVASVRVDLNKLLTVLVAKINQNLSLLMPIQLEASLRGLACLNHINCRKIRLHAVQRLASKPDSFTDQHAISVLRSAISLGERCRDQISKISERLDFTKLTPQCISLYAWCLMKIGGDPMAHRLPELVEEVSARRHKFGPLYVGKTLSSLSSFAYSPGPEFLDWAGDVFALKLNYVSPDILGSSLNAFCNLNHMPKKFMEAFLFHFSEWNERYTIGQIVDILWCLSIMGLLNQGVIDLARNRFKDLPVGILNQRDLVKMFQVTALLCLKPPDNLNVEGLLSPDLLEGCKSRWVGLQERKIVPACMDSVLDLLRSKGFTTDSCVMMEELPLAVSVATKDGVEKEKYVVEFQLRQLHYPSKNLPIVLRARHRWRYQVFSTLNYGIICLEMSHYLSLKTLAAQEAYVMGSLYPPGESPSPHAPTQDPSVHGIPHGSVSSGDHQLNEADGERDGSLDCWVHEEDIGEDLPEDCMSQGQASGVSVPEILEAVEENGNLDSPNSLHQ